MECSKCNNQMFIDEWNGWLWTCIECENTTEAKDKEVYDYEEAMLPHREELQRLIFETNKNKKK